MIRSETGSASPRGARAKPKSALLAAVAVLALGAAAAWYLLQATALAVAVAPRDGIELEFIKDYPDALNAGDEGVRLKTLSFDEVRESAAALQDGRACESVEGDPSRNRS